MEDFSHRDVITIEIRGEQAREILGNLLNLVTSLDVRARELGVAFDTATTHIVGPLKSIEVSTAQLVREMEMLRQEVAALGPAGQAGPEAVSQYLRRMRTELGLTAVDANRLRYELSQIGTIPMLPPAGRMMQAQAGIGAFAPTPTEPSPTMYVTPKGTAFFEQQRQLVLGYEDAEAAAKKYGAAVGGVTPKVDRATGSFQRHIRWFIEGTILYMTISRTIRAVGDALSDMISILSEYDVAMAQMSFITGEAEARLGDLAYQVAAIGLQYAQLPEETIPGLVDITRAFKDQGDQLIMTENASRLALMTGISYTAAVDQLVAITKQFNIDVSETGKILDLAAIGYRTAMVPMDDFLRGLAKGAPLAGMMGLEIEELAGFMAALSEITILEPEQQITLLRRITAAMYRPTVAPELLQQYGIPVYQPGAPAERRPPIDILRDVMRIWGDITEEQQTYLANLLAGSQAIGGMGPLLKQVLDSQAKVNEVMAEFTAEAEKGGQAQELIDERMGALREKIVKMTGAWELFLLTVGETQGILEGIKSAIDSITEGLGAWTEAERERLETGISAPARWIGGLFGLSPEQMQALSRWLATPVGRAQTTLRQLEEAQGIAPTAEGLPTRLPALREPPRPVGRFISEEEVLEYQQRQLLATTDQWIRQLDIGRGIIDVTALSQQQINDTLAMSTQMVQSLADGYIAATEAMQGGLITAEQREEIEKKVKEWYEDQTVILKEQEGVFRVIAGAQAAMFQQAMKQMEAVDRMGVRRLKDFTPGMLSQVVQMAQVWEQRLAMMGFEEERKRALLIGEDPTFWLTFEGGMTALRFAISDLQDAMEDQTAVLRGHFNIPGGYVVPTPWDYYADVGMQGPVGVGPVNYPPEVLERYYGYQFGGGGGAGGVPGLFGGLGTVPTAWAGTIPRRGGWDVGDWAGGLGQAAEMYGLDPRLLAAIMQVESGGAPEAIGAPTRWGRAQGLMQVMPFHEGRLQPGEALTDPWANIRIGAEILAEAIGKYGIPTGVAAYYGGVREGAVTPAGEEYLRLVEQAFGELFGGRPEGQEVMAVQGMPEMQRVLSATKTTQDSYLGTGVQQLIQVNQTLQYILVAIRQQLQPQVTVVMPNAAAQVSAGRRTSRGAGGAIVGHRPELYQ